MNKDLLWALRWLRKNPFFTAAVTGILALGIGANTAVFSIVDAVLLHPLPYEGSSRLVRIEEASANEARNAVPAQDYYVRLRGRSDLFERIAAHQTDDVTITGANEPDQVFALRTSAGLFSLLGVCAELVAHSWTPTANSMRPTPPYSATGFGGGGFMPTQA
jgi:hypothetical protein